MRLYDKISISKIARLTHYLVIILIGINILVLLTLPWLINQVIQLEIGYGYSSMQSNVGMYIYFLTILYISGMIALVILNDLRHIFKSCISEHVFVRENVTRLYKMAIATGLICLVFFTKIFVVNSIMTMVIVFVFFMASVFCFVIALLFDQSVDYKEEIDLTI